MNTECTKSSHCTGAALLSAALLAFTSCSSNPTPPPGETTGAIAYQEGVPGGVIVNTVKVTAKVTAIDLAKRKVTLLGSDGKTFTVKAGPAAVNLDQVRVGDQVNATVAEQLVVYVSEEGAAPSDGSAALVSLAPKGAQPGGVVAETTQVTAKVTAIDLKHRKATLQFEDGSTKTVAVRSDVDLSKRKVGDQVMFQITDMIAISVDKP
jgi:translation elongation factor P/translation initiation factor 5A